MKLSDYVTEFLAGLGIKDAFVLTGGCIVHIIDSISRNNRINYVPVQHEQAGAMAADAYARLTENLAVVLTTSGPGATNLLTGLCCSYYDSIPVIAITGQVPTSQLKGDSGSRQIGFQETDVVSIFKPVTKYAKLIDDPATIRYELEKSVFIAKNGRPGPVLLDICDDVQRAEINPEELPSYVPPQKNSLENEEFSKKIFQVVELINQSSRPVIIVGGGVRLAGAIKLITEVIDQFQIPFTLTWSSMDYLSHESELYVGGFGVTSGRPGNFAVQNADLILALGTRLDTHEAGSNLGTFTREAKRVVVDIDRSELKKHVDFGLSVDVLVEANAKIFLTELISHKDKIKTQDLSEWYLRIKSWKHTYPICLKEYHSQPEWVNPYVFMEELSSQTSSEAQIITDCGSNLIWTMQGYKVKSSKQRVISAFNHSPMGYSLPAAIGAAVANPQKQTICLIGDGGLQINIQELATISRQNLNIKIFVLNNHGHGIIQGTQDNWLEGRHHAAHPDHGLPDPNFEKIAQAYEIVTETIDTHQELSEKIKKVLGSRFPILCNVNLKQGPQIAPKLLYGRPIEDSDPLLPREEFQANMIVKTLDA